MTGLFVDQLHMTEAAYREHCWMFARANMYEILEELSGGDTLPLCYSNQAIEQLRDEVAASFNHLLWTTAVEKSSPETRAALRDPKFQRFMDMVPPPE